MRRDLIKNIESSFLSISKDTQTILRKLFMENIQHSNELKKLLVINAPDCLDDSASVLYNPIVNQMTIKDLKSKDFIKIQPKIKLQEFDEVKTHILISYDNFIQTSNPQFRDCIIVFDIISHIDCWEMNDYQIRPLKICGYIDGLLNGCKLSGIGTLNFLSCKEVVLNDVFAGYSLTYEATHGSDDRIPGTDE